MSRSHSDPSRPTPGLPPSDSNAPAPGPAADAYDVVVVGGAVAGAGTALLIRRFHPGARVLVVESRDRVPRKVGEATVEVSGFYLQQVLGQADRLDVPSAFWVAEDTFIQLHEVTLPAGLPAGEYPLQVGAYYQNDWRRRLPLLVRGEVAGDAISLPPLTIGPH